MATTVDVKGLTNWQPYEGLGDQDLLGFDGKFVGLIEKAKVGKSKQGREMITLAIIVQDKDELGKRLIHNVTIGGTDSKGNPMIRQLGDLLFSIGFTPDQIKAVGGKGTVDVDELVAKHVQKKLCYMDVVAEKYVDDTGRERVSSKVKNLITKAQYDDSVAVRSHRKPHPFAQGFSAQAPAGDGSTITPGPATEVATKSSAPSANADPLAAGL